ncbi:hypothetical protein HJG60_008162 [Phyllostomus discolor]|uniref:Uncharacterized protein n=1 Tax=Phyllostomus discolor TaxID=89673 RepID=A0A833ZC97_9CHIR|nr:hypothetical protein HJG60_008162 [Phyllostomus discolor]
MSFKRRCTGNILMNSQKSMKKRKPQKPPRERVLISKSGPRLRTELRKGNGARPSNLLGSLLPAWSVSHSDLVDGGEEWDGDIQTCKAAESSPPCPFSGSHNRRSCSSSEGWVKKVHAVGSHTRPWVILLRGEGQSPGKSVAPGQCRGRCCEAGLGSSPSLQGGAKKT